jgi:IclR family KDG regulon transcriptional repressor
MHCAMRKGGDCVKDNKIKSILKAMNILECFNQSQPELSLSDISKRLAMEPSTVRRMLMSLEEGDFIKQDNETRKYSLGNALVRLGAVAIQNFDIRKIAYPYMKELSEQSHENVYLAIHSGNQSLYIEVVEYTQEIVLTGSIGSARPLHSTGTGKVLLAHFPEEEIEKIINNELESFPLSTVTNLRQDLKRIREEGIAVVAREYHKDVYSIATPIFDSRQQVIASLAISGPAFRLDDKKMEEFKTLVIQTGKEISEKIGYSKNEEVYYASN